MATKQPRKNKTEKASKTAKSSSKAKAPAKSRAPAKAAASAKADKTLALEVIQEHGLPRGEIVKLLEKSGIEQATINKVAARMVPYTYT